MSLFSALLMTPNIVLHFTRAYTFVADDSDSGFSISNTPRGTLIVTNGDSFYDQESVSSNEKGACNNNISTKENRGKESPTYATVQKAKGKLPIKRNGINLWTYKVPQPTNGVCHCSENSDSDDVNQASLTLDLLREERRETVESSDSSREHDKHDNTTASLSRSLKLNIKPVCKSETKDKTAITPRYVKNKHLNGNVADCSARTLPKSLQLRIRSNSHTSTTEPRSNNKQLHSFSVEDLPVRVLRQRPSASFEAAIERGYSSDVNIAHKKSASLSEDESQRLRPSKTPQSLHETMKPTVSSRLPMHKRRSALLKAGTHSVSSDDVFVDNPTGKIYNQETKEILMQSLPHKFTLFKPISTSSQELRSKQFHVTNNPNIKALNFDSNSRRSSIELTKDNLYFHNGDALDDADDNFEISRTNENGSDVDDDSTCDADEEFSGELFTEVNEKTLADMKRHGSSLNVAPSCENSPRMSNKPCEFSHRSIPFVLNRCVLVTVCINVYF